MPIFAITHARRHSDMGNPHHTDHGLEDLFKLKEIASFLEGREERLKLVAFGVGSKYEDIMQMFRMDEAFIRAEILMTPMLGGVESKGENGVTSPSGSTYKNYWGWEALTQKYPEVFWHILEEKFPCKEDEIILLCLGKQFFTYIGKERYFKIASIYELFMSKRFIKLREDLNKKKNRNRIIKQ